MEDGNFWHLGSVTRWNSQFLILTWTFLVIIYVASQLFLCLFWISLRLKNKCLQHLCFENLCKIAQASKNSNTNAQHLLSDLLTHSWFFTPRSLHSQVTNSLVMSWIGVSTLHWYVRLGCSTLFWMFITTIPKEKNLSNNKFPHCTYLNYCYLISHIYCSFLTKEWLLWGGGGWRGATRRNGGRHHVTVFGSPVFPGLGTTESVARPSLALSSSWNLNQGITRSTHVCKFLFPSWASITISPSRNIASVLLPNSKEHNASSATDLVQMNPVSLSEKKNWAEKFEQWSPSCTRWWIENIEDDDTQGFIRCCIPFVFAWWILLMSFLEM